MNQNFLAATNNNNKVKIWNLKDDIIYHSDHRIDENDERIRTFETIICDTG